MYKELQFNFQTNSVSCRGYRVPPPHSPPDKLWHRPFEVKLRIIETTADIIRGTQLLMCSAERQSVTKIFSAWNNKCLENYTLFSVEGGNR